MAITKLAAKDGNKASQNIIAAENAAGDLATAHHLVDADGNSLSSAERVHLFGERENMDAAGSGPGEDITRFNELTPAPTNDAVLPIPASAGEQMSVVSENTNDTSTGTGVRTVMVRYIDGNGADQETTVTMNGTTAVDLTPSDVAFVNDIYTLTAGSGGVAAGNIKIYKKTDTGIVYNMIYVGGNKSTVPAYMVPSGKKLILEHWHAAEAQSKRVNVRIRTTAKNGVIVSGVFLFKDVIYLNQTTSGALPLYEIIPAGAIIKVTGWGDLAGAECSCSFMGRLVDV